MALTRALHFALPDLDNRARVELYAVPHTQAAA